MVAVVLYDTHFISFMKDAMLKDAVAEREELLALVPAELPDSLGRLGAGVEELLDVVEFVYLAQPYIIADRTYLLLEVGDGAHFGLLQLDDAAVAEGVEQPEEADTVILIMDMEQGFHPKVGKADGVFIILAQAIVTVVADKQVELPERIGLFLLLVHHGRLFSPLGLVAGLCHGILPQAGLSVDLAQLLDALFIYELVLYITKQVANVIDAVDFPEQRTGRGKLLLCQPDDEMLFLQVAVDFFAQDVAVRILLDRNFTGSVWGNVFPFIMAGQFLFRQFPGAEGQFLDRAWNPFRMASVPHSITALKPGPYWPSGATSESGMKQREDL